MSLLELKCSTAVTLPTHQHVQTLLDHIGSILLIDLAIIAKKTALIEANRIVEAVLVHHSNRRRTEVEIDHHKTTIAVEEEETKVEDLTTSLVIIAGENVKSL